MVNKDTKKIRGPELLALSGVEVSKGDASVGSSGVENQATLITQNPIFNQYPVKNLPHEIPIINYFYTPCCTVPYRKRITFIYCYVQTAPIIQV